MPSTTGKSLDELKQMRKDLMSQGQQLSTSKSLGKIEQAIKVANPSGYSADQVSSAQQNLKLINEPTVSGMGTVANSATPTSDASNLEKLLADKQDALVKATSNVNDNPWYSEATRVDKLAKLNNIAQLEISNIQSQVAQKKQDEQYRQEQEYKQQLFDFEKEKYYASKTGNAPFDLGLSTESSVVPTTPMPKYSPSSGIGTVSGEWIYTGKGTLGWEPNTSVSDSSSTLNNIAKEMAKRGDLSGAANIIQKLESNQVADKQAKALRTEFTSKMNTLGHQDAITAYNRVLQSSTQDSPGGDLAMIFSFMKLLDPTSVVRENEQASAQNAAAVPDRIRNLYNRVLKGTRLTPNQRADFLNQAKQQIKGYQDSANQITQYYNNLAISQGVDTYSVTGGVTAVMGGSVGTDTSTRFEIEEIKEVK